MNGVSIGEIALSVKEERFLQNLEDDMGRLMPYIKDERVTDIAIGHNGRLIVEGIGMGKVFTDVYFTDEETKRIILACAAVLDVTVDRNNPVVEGTLTKWKYKPRVEGILPPRAAERPMLFIRRPSKILFTLEDYLEKGQITRERYDLLVGHIERRSNIIVAGSVGSGKTTLVNAVIAKMCEFTPEDRFYIVEDAGEIQCAADDVVPIWAEGEDCVKAVQASLRCNVARIIFGELRKGSVTNELLKSWNTGNPGGVSTVHADSALLAVKRLRDLLREVMKGDYVPDISEYVQLLVYMRKTAEGREVSEVVELHQDDGDSTFMEELEGNNLI